MNKKELISALAEHTGATQSDAGDMLNAFIEVTMTELRQGDGSKVVIPGFGQFVSKFRDSREIRNPATGKMMMSKPKLSASFKPSSVLKDL